MKKVMTILVTITLLFGIGGFAYAPEHIAEVDNMLEAHSTDYMAAMITAATLGDYEAGQEAEQARNEKIDALGMDFVKIEFEALYLLAKIAQCEAGDVTVNGDEVCKGIMQVVMNRVDSPLFPDSVRDALWQRGQYYIGSGHEAYFERTQPTERVVLIARRVLEGDRDMLDAIYHANMPIGQIVKSTDMAAYGTMYFCK